MKAVVVASAMIVALSSPALAWGDRGHSIVAEIAQRHLTPQALQGVRTLLGSNASMASLGSWADDYKFTDEGLATKPWHFVDVDNTHADYQPSDCPAEGCLVSALTNQATILGDQSKPADARKMALLFLIHFVGDSTQPFHCDERGGDGGANKVKIDFQGLGPDNKPHPAHNTNLHAVWDDLLINAHSWNWGSYVDDLDTKVVPTLPQPTYGTGFAETWINECHLVAQPLYALTPANGGTAIVVDSAYQQTVQPALDKQLATGGLRLAVMLNAVFP